MKNNHLKFLFLAVILFVGPSLFASSMGGYSFFAGPLEAITTAFTGPITRAVGILAFVGAFGMLMFGADLTSFAKTLLWTVMICSALVNVVSLFDAIAGGTGALM